jgi:hypothetical protein
MSKSAIAILLGCIWVSGCSAYEEPTRPDTGLGGGAGAGTDSSAGAPPDSSRAGAGGSGGPDSGGGGGVGGSGGLDAAAGTGGTGGTGGGGTDIFDAFSRDILPNDDGSIPPDAAVGSCAPSNWNVSASGSGLNLSPLNAIDGLLPTRWSTGAGQVPGQYYQIDFRGYVQLSQISLNSSGSMGDYPRGYELLISTDDVNYSGIIATGTVDVAPPNDIVTITFPLRAVRYLRIQQTGVVGNWWSINELTAVCNAPSRGADSGTDSAMDPLRCGGDAGVRDAGSDGPSSDGGDAGTSDPFNRVNWTATVSHVSDASGTPSNAFDGDLATRWTSGTGQVGNEWFKLDLGSIGCIGQVLVTSAGNDFASAHRIGISADGATYTVVATGIGQNPLQVVFPPRLTRYILIEQTGSAAFWWSIHEISVQP